MSTNGHLLGKVDCQTQSTVYFEEDLETCDGTPARFEEPIDIDPLSEDSSITEKWDCENVEASVSKVHIKKLDTYFLYSISIIVFSSKLCLHEQ